jgi:centromere/kinetochore protein ZW10
MFIFCVKLFMSWHHFDHSISLLNKLMHHIFYYKGSLLNAAIDDIIECILEIEEFSVEDCECLKKVLSSIPKVAVDFFTIDGANANPQVCLHENVPSWLRFTEIIMLLASGLQDISDRWADGKGPLAMYLNSDEVRRMVLAMFENTSKREKVLKEILKPSVSSLPLPAFPMKRMKSSPL